MSFPDGLRRFNRQADRVLFWSVAAFACLFFGTVLLAVFSRYLFKLPILASIELSRLFFIWSCFLAVGTTYRRRAHVTFALLFEKSPERLQRWGVLLVHVLIILFSVVILYQSVRILLLLWPTDLPMLGISQGWLYVPLPLVSALLVLFALEFLIDDQMRSVSRGVAAC